MIPALLAALLLALPAAAQAPRCGFGLGLEALRGAERQVQAGLAAGDLPAGRAAAEAAAASLEEAATRLGGCGCAQAAGFAREAQGLAEQARSEAVPERIARALDRARFSLGLARERLERRGCS
ncbi:hypothetical protein [Paracraurococcus lichenis]|uniref:Uncharacterized protein n=1 Tax=Paracraurococcus lichenis TaxID=3064888 RepID=A0ABT9DZ47_9PROT|nr:hypothetical protein [Paracraurococcus sp. LOR1-02]MDO9709161.1 hypothetical protein [Paracraurococcus sp. LOR1-02]